MSRRAGPWLADRWCAFWFAPADPRNLAMVRIACGAISLAWAVTLGFDLGPFYSTTGLTGGTSPERDWWVPSPLTAAGSDLAVAAVYVALLCGSTALAIGWRSRWSAAVVFLAMTALARANPYVSNSGDTLLRLLAFYLLIAPSGAAMSLDRRRALRAGGSPTPVVHRVWPLRLIQIQLSVVYAAAVWTKLHGLEWRDGTAASFAMRLPDLVRFPAPSLVGRSELAAAVATYGVIVVEAVLAACLFSRRTRVPALLAGVALHLSIDLTIRVGFFTLAVLAAYLSATEASWFAAAARAVRRRARARGRRAPVRPRTRGGYAPRRPARGA